MLNSMQLHLETIIKSLSSVDALPEANFKERGRPKLPLCDPEPNKYGMKETNARIKVATVNDMPVGHDNLDFE